MRLRSLLPVAAGFGLGLTLGAPRDLGGQAFVRLAAGATMSSSLVGEVIEDPISQRPSLSPTGAVTLGWTFRQGYRLGVEARYSTGTLEVHDDGASGSDDLGGLTTLQVGVFGDGPLQGAFRWEAAVGMLRYSPEQAIGVFRDGNPSPLTIGGGIAWHRPLGSVLQLVIAARYDYHAFNTTRLETQGYSGTQAVHRGALTLGIERGL